MKSLLLAPHNDDETLFAAFTCLGEKPHVVTVLRSQTQEDRYGITALTREAETQRAMWMLGCSWEQWPPLDTDPDWEGIEMMLRNRADKYERCFAPAREVNGHRQHNRIADIAQDVFGAERVTHYLTYTTSGKSTSDRPVAFEPEWVERKMAALACYRSQSSLANCAEHFLRDQHEYLAA
jgi:LmbE family N-acetylglucosaminyl deacetylase